MLERYIFNEETDVIRDPIPILQQTKSKIITDPYIRKREVEKELIKRDVRKSKTLENISENVMGIIDDILNKPDDVLLRDYIVEILKKNNRYIYIIVICILIILLISP